MSRFGFWQSLDAPRRLIVIAAAGLAVLILWAAFAEVDSVTRGMGKVIPSSKAQLVQPAEPAVIEEILVRGGQSVKKGQLLVRLDDAQSASELGQLQTENQQASGGALGCEEGTLCAEERQLQQARRAAANARERSLGAAVEQRRRDLREAEATVDSLRNSVRLAREQVQMLEPPRTASSLARNCFRPSGNSTIFKGGCRRLSRLPGALLPRSARRRPISIPLGSIFANRRSTSAARSRPGSL